MLRFVQFTLHKIMYCIIDITTVVKDYVHIKFVFGYYEVKLIRNFKSWAYILLGYSEVLTTSKTKFL